MKFNVSHIAKLANLHIDKNELELLSSQLTKTLTYINILKDINTENTPNTDQVTGLKNVVRDDIVTSSFTQEEALLNAKDSYKGFFKVKGILENE